VINGQRYSRVFGGTVPAPIWADFMQRMLANVPVAEFPEDPPGTAEYFKTPTTVVPSVVGLDVATAETTLRLAKLSVTIEEVASLEPVGTVVAQSLEIGATVNQGTAIVISVSTGETPSAALPSLVGLTFNQAVEAIRLFEEETGVNVTLRREDVDVLDPAQRGRVIGTNPPPGAVVQYGAVITAIVGR
jgi:beta-lactam-binding protein with PASTA domain